jgi:hypothetical protein
VQQDIRSFKRVREQADAQATTFDRTAWQANYIHWIIADDVSLGRAVRRASTYLIGGIKTALGTQPLASWLLTTLRRPLVVQNASGPSR